MLFGISEWDFAFQDSTVRIDFFFFEIHAAIFVISRPFDLKNKILLANEKKQHI
jgi:hypothetical protein